MQLLVLMVRRDRLPDFIVSELRDANALRALVGHNVGDFNTSCLQQTDNQSRLSCEVG